MEASDSVIVPIDKITVRPGRREPLPEKIRTMADSIAETTLLHPITINQHYILIAGLHRLEAVKLLGWTSIPCTICDLDGPEAELAEIDENIVRNDLDNIEMGKILLRRKELYEQLHPYIKHGGDRKSEKIKTKPSRFDSEKPFTVDTSEKTGLSRRTIEQKMQIARDLVPQAQEIVKENHIGYRNALCLSRLKPDQQADAAKQLAEGHIKDVSDYSGPEQKYDDELAANPSDDNILSDEKSRDDEPFTIVREQFEGFDDSLADLKNPDKDFSCTAESFLDEFMCLAQKIKRDIDWYQDPYYQETLCNLSKKHLNFLREQVDSICSSARTFYKSVERKSRK